MTKQVAFPEAVVSAMIEAPSGYWLSEAQRQVLWYTDAEQIHFRVQTRMLVRKSIKKDQRLHRRHDNHDESTDSTDGEDSLRGLECHLNRRRVQVKKRTMDSILMFQSQLLQYIQDKDGSISNTETKTAMQQEDFTTLLGEFAAHSNKDAVLQGILMATKDRAQANHIYQQDECQDCAAKDDAAAKTDDRKQYPSCSAHRNQLAAVPVQQTMKEAVARSA